MARAAAELNPARKLRLVFMGTPHFAATALSALVGGGDELALVVSQPDRPKGRGRHLNATPVKETALAHGLPVTQPESPKDADFLGQIAQIRPDAIIVVAYGRILPPALLALPPLGCLNIHASLLPAHRGAAPVQWSIINGDREVGVSVMRMDASLDTGAVLLQKAIYPATDETAATLFAKLASLGAAALLETLALLKTGGSEAKEQDDRLATWARPLKKEDGLIDWTRPAKELHRLVRGLDPWPTAFSYLDGQKFQFFAPEVVYQSVSKLPGTVLFADKRGLLVACGENALLLREIQAAGKKRLPAASFLLGQKIAPMSRFTPSS
ncbi:MAG: methionyl-tRNA formyltransferase [Desulfobulbaceae bacterium]|jgi:methionyl-tRNA formyltransferase|nr:methionyl-tRNA formyltransferase [Desulfobulbaceae bacterium]